MKNMQESTEKFSVEEYTKKSAKKKRIIKLIFSLIIISITAGTVVGISFAIGVVNKHNEKTGEIQTGNSFSVTRSLKNIYK